MMKISFRDQNQGAAQYARSDDTQIYMVSRFF